MSGPNGPLASVELRIRSTSGAVQDFTTVADGAYHFTVAPGTYDLFVTRTGHSSFTKRGLSVVEGQKARLDIKLTATINEGTPGEYPSLSLRDRTPLVTGPVPVAADGRPDLSGVWLPGSPTEADDPPLKPWAADLARQRMAAGSSTDPRAWCLPSGTTRTNNADLTKFVQTPNLLIILLEGASPGFRQIFLSKDAKHPANLPPTWMGHSVGHWEGDTLVVDTVDFNDRGWIDNAGDPQTEQLHVIERFHRVSRGVLEVAITIDDPGAYEKPWTFHRILHLTESDDLMEAVCNENLKNEHFVGNR